MFNFFKKDPKEIGTPQKKESLQALWKLVTVMLVNLQFENVVTKIVNSILDELGYMNLGYRIVVLSLIDEEARGLRRIALSQTKEAELAKERSSIPFENIVIPFSATANLCVKVILEGKPFVTSYWPDILSPPLTPEAALVNQQNSGIKTSMVYPVFAAGKPVGSLIFSMVKDYREVTDDEKDLLNGFADLVGLAVQNSKLFTSLQITSHQLKVANEKLKVLDQLKDEFVSVASHELRTPMTAIRSYVWMALHKSDITLSQKLERYLYRTLVSTERLINLVNDMLNVSRIESGHIEITPRPFDILALVRDVMEEVQSKADEKKLQLLVLEHKMPQVFADAAKVHEILLNLVGNSLKFTYPGGSISVDFFTDGKMVEVSIRDNGSGIAKADLAKLFKKFGRLDNSYVPISTSGGTGLGLYISKSLVEMMHGSIRASSDGVDKGSTFSFSLPIATEQILKDSEKYHIRPKEGIAKTLEPVAI